MAYTNSLVQSGNTYYYVATTVDTTGVESIFANEMPSVIPATLKRQLLRCERCAPTSVVDRVTIRQAMPARMQMNEYLQEIDTQAPLEIRCHNGG
jgi:fibronectin type 3 domain-containing protein